MSHSVDWDIDSYRTTHESEEHWELRKKFMERWKNDYPEDRLVCLARVFSNIEFLGCRYPPEVMRLVADLSKDVASDFRESRKTKLHRTFVSASDAAGDKVKGVKRKVGKEKDSGPAKKKLFVAENANKKTILSHRKQMNESNNRFHEPSSNTDHNINQNLNSQSIRNLPPASNSNPIDNTETVQRVTKETKKSKKEKIERELKTESGHLISSEYGQLVLYECPGTSFVKICGSCGKCKVPFKSYYTGQESEWTFTIVVNNIVLSSETRPSKKEAKEAAGDKAWELLRKKVYMIITKTKHLLKNDAVISVDDVNKTSGLPKDKLKDGLDTKVESAVATRMMRMMGWKGGALGSSGGGISEPIQPNLKQIRRKGLGSNTGGHQSSLQVAVRKILQDYAHDGCPDYDLAFSSDFTKDERAMIHKTATRMNLKTKSYDKEENRYIVVSKPLSVLQQVKNLIELGGSNQKYELVPPTDQ